jgi:ABC-2 type transport system permease protein
MVSASSELAAKIIILNPISQAIQDIRHNLITTETVTTWNYLDNNFLKILPIIIVLILLCASALYFRKKSKFFAEEV